MPEKYRQESEPEEVKPKLTPEELAEKQYKMDAKLGPIIIANAKNLEYQDKLAREKELKKKSRKPQRKIGEQTELGL